ncbi:hypothetical protein HCH_04061 [Hahella chejuensis KCTC 2396]|uniref:Uncharacterized protein n=1 Tax=Hahella chejuensis (strain KCTC 2396) TaxID=349521 RepID=Q2SEZ8_HAHCH|nr:hypothetical protein HCH_04061 [Hahella chejuensis KCTC 2396]
MHPDYVRAAIYTTNTVEAAQRQFLKFASFDILF